MNNSSFNSVGGAPAGGWRERQGSSPKNRSQADDGRSNGRRHQEASSPTASAGSGSPKDRRSRGGRSKKHAGAQDPGPLTGLKTTMLKTALCRHWERGHCKYQDQCGFAHGDEELRSAQQQAQQQQQQQQQAQQQQAQQHPPQPAQPQHQLPQQPQRPQQHQPTLPDISHASYAYHAHPSPAVSLPSATNSAASSRQPSLANPSDLSDHITVEGHIPGTSHPTYPMQGRSPTAMPAQPQSYVDPATLMHMMNLQQQMGFAGFPTHLQLQAQAELLSHLGQQVPMNYPQNPWQQPTASTPAPHPTPPTSGSAVGPQDEPHVMGHSTTKDSALGSPTDTPLVTSYGGAPLEHSLQAQQMGMLAQTVGMLPYPSSQRDKERDNGSENPLSTNPELLQLVLSQRRTKGFIVRLGPEPLVALPGVGCFSFNYKSVKKDHQPKLQIGCRVDFRLSQSHPPRAVSLRLLGDSQAINLNAVQEQLALAQAAHHTVMGRAMNNVSHSSMNSSVPLALTSPATSHEDQPHVNHRRHSAPQGKRGKKGEEGSDAKKEDAGLGLTQGSDSTQDWPTTRSAVSAGDDASNEDETAVTKPAATACAGAIAVVQLSGKFSKPLPAAAARGGQAGEADVDAILAEILDLTDSPAGVPLGGPSVPTGPPNNISLPPDPYPPEVMAAAWTVGLGGIGPGGGLGTVEAASLSSLTLPVGQGVPNLSHTFPPPGSPTIQQNAQNAQRRMRSRSKGPETPPELLVVRLQLECFFNEGQPDETYSDGWWSLLLPADKTPKPGVGVINVGLLLAEYPHLASLRCTEPLPAYEYVVKLLQSSVTEARPLPETVGDSDLADVAVEAIAQGKTVDASNWTFGDFALVFDRVMDEADGDLRQAQHYVIAKLNNSLSFPPSFDPPIPSTGRV